ncbi:MAG TPA: hypothetical protein VI076_14025 [Actinopolymorphaceae bacterium]
MDAWRNDRRRAEPEQRLQGRQRPGARPDRRSEEGDTRSDVREEVRRLAAREWHLPVASLDDSTALLELPGVDRRSVLRAVAVVEQRYHVVLVDERTAPPPTLAAFVDRVLERFDADR